jgi:release factor glutamine methyltransferase
VNDAVSTVQQALQAARALGLDRLEAQHLLLHALGKSPAERAWLLAHDVDALPADAHDRFTTLYTRRASGEPLAYITGRQAFYGLDLHVDARVLIPRPDTETLVDWALALMTGMAAPRVLDLGTGSGAIALAIRHQRPDATVTAVDASRDALAVARANATQLGLAIDFRHGHWLDGVEGNFDLIVSNPPYIANGDAHLPGLAHEPRSALTSGTDGLDDLREIVSAAPSHLSPGGWLLLEHGWDQAAAVRPLLAGHGFTEVTSRKDLAGIERCSGGKRPVLG